jgi:hypothetical protein
MRMMGKTDENSRDVQDVHTTLEDKQPGLWMSEVLYRACQSTILPQLAMHTMKTRQQKHVAIVHGENCQDLKLKLDHF